MEFKELKRLVDTGSIGLGLDMCSLECGWGLAWWLVVCVCVCGRKEVLVKAEERPVVKVRVRRWYLIVVVVLYVLLERIVVCLVGCCFVCKFVIVVMCSFLCLWKLM